MLRDHDAADGCAEDPATKPHIQTSCEERVASLTRANRLVSGITSDNSRQNYSCELSKTARDGAEITPFSTPRG